MAEVEIPTGDVEVPKSIESDADRGIGLFIAIVAVLMAVNSALGGKSDNDEIVNRVNASNSWSYYQAKRIRSHQIELTADLARVGGAAGPAAKAEADRLGEKLAEGVEKYRKEAEEISAQAKTQEKAADEAERKGNLFDLGEVLFQITVVLCSVALLTKQKLFFRMGQGFCAAATAALAYAFFF